VAEAAPERGCGSCGLCCKLLSAPSLGKPPRKWCVHFRRRSGCDIYADRPAECRGFNCGWLLTPSLADDWRPDRCGFLLHQDEGRVIVEVDPSTPQAWKKPPFEATLRAWATAGTEVVVLVADKGLRLGVPDRPVKAQRT
jgi:hypothetical protein